MTDCDFVLDTNAVIYLQKGLLAAPLRSGRFAISVITEIELRSFAGLAAEQEEALRHFFASIGIIGLSESIQRPQRVDQGCDHSAPTPTPD